MKLSIIMPVYNGEKFIKKSLDNVLQVDCEKEIIVINDCSKDKSLEILKEYGSQIKLIDLKENKGVSHARNLGIEKATGDYVYFLDIDDVIELEMLPKMLEKISKEDADVCVCNYDEIFENSDKVVNSKYDLEFDNTDKESVVKYYLLDRISPAPWDKIIKTNLVKNLNFDERLAVGEDLNFVVKLFLNAKKTVFVKERLFHYLQQSGSVMHNISPKFLQFQKVVEYLEPKYKVILEKYYVDEFEFFKTQMITRGIHSISVLANKNNKKQAKEFLKEYSKKEKLNQVLKCKFVSKAIKLECFILKWFGINVHLWLTPIYIKIRNRKRS